MAFFVYLDFLAFLWLYCPTKTGGRDMSTEKAQQGFDKLIADNCFTLAGYTSDTGIPIYHRVWTMQEDTLEVRIMLSGTYPLVTIKRNGRIDNKFIRDYSSPQRAIQRYFQLIISFSV